MGDFRKNIVKTDFKGKNSCKEIPGEKIPVLKKLAYNAGKIHFTPLQLFVCQEKCFFTLGFGKKILTQTNHPYTPQKSDGRLLRT